MSGLVPGGDGYLYYAMAKQLVKHRYHMFLCRMSLSTFKKEEVCPMDDGEWHSQYIAKATRDFYGNLYFADCANRPSRVYIYTPEGCSGERAMRRYHKSWG